MKTIDLRDHRDHVVTGATPAALAIYEAALQELQCYRGDPLATIDRALQEAPGFVMARAFKAYVGAIATERPALAITQGELVALEAMPQLTEREAMHRAALRALAVGEWHAGIATLDELLARWPRDVLALQVAHIGCFFVGDARGLRDTAGRVRRAWDSSVPGLHAVLGMHAFGLEECGDYARAEAAGLCALELQPGDAWAHHAVTHVMEMTGRVDDGVQWMAARAPAWETGSLAIHLWWHQALFLLERDDVARVLALYDDRLRGTGSKVALDLVDASALLWRLYLRGVDVGARCAALAETWAPAIDDALYAFNDAHAAMAFLGAGRRDLFAALRANLARPGSGANEAMRRDVGLPLVDALAEFVDGDHAAACAHLHRVRPIAHRFGGSHAQRDLIDLTIAEAALRGGDVDMARAIAREREELRPGHRSARRILARADAAPPTDRAALG